MKTALPVGVVILGAGESKRMGRPKLLLPWGGTTVIGHIIGQWQELGARQIAVVMRENDTNLGAELKRLKLGGPSNRIKNLYPERGMFSSIICAANFNRWKPEIMSFAIVLGDQPHLRLETLRALLRFHNEHSEATCQPEFQGRPQHPVLLPRKVFNELKRTRTETLKDFLKLIPCPAVLCPVHDIGVLLDLDTPGDYIEAMTRFSA
ncbi:MAG TPA: nucleotidyltransferase family protein [Alphaproteobacteria bacterium]|nr:nucleotidyltransferase family protein [Alphaproteobacteria bacterium]